MYVHKTRNILDLNSFNDAAKQFNVKIQIVLKFGVDDLRFTLSGALTPQEDIDLDNFVASFADSDPEQSVPLIYDYTKGEANSKHFHNIDYKRELIVSLIPIRTIVKGELVKVDWYASMDAATGTIPENLILSVSVSYNRDTTGFATYRVTNRTWYNRDGTANTDVKTTTKHYFVNHYEMIVEGLRRRKLLVNNLQIPVLTFMKEVLASQGYSDTAIMLKGRAFLDDYEDDFSKFIENSSTITDPADVNFGRKSVIVQLEDSAAAGRNINYNEWLDLAPPSIGGMTTIRQFLINEFDI